MASVAPAPLQSFLGGNLLSLPVHALLTLNGSIFGISGFIHRSIKGDLEAIEAVLGFLAGGLVVGLVRPHESLPLLPVQSLPLTLFFSGLLVGIGTKLGNGCTSGHMLCGLSRFSPRSFAATATFFATGAASANIVHFSSFPPLQEPLDCGLSHPAKALLLGQVPFVASWIALYLTRTGEAGSGPQRIQRQLAVFSASCSFALALSLSGLTSASRVIRFLILPFPKSHLTKFDPSLAFLAAGALPSVVLLYQTGFGFIRKSVARPSEQNQSESDISSEGKTSPVPALGGVWKVPTSKLIDARLLIGAATFGVGWGISGICPGPGIVNLGHSLIIGSRDSGSQYFLWLGACVIGGSLV